MFIGYHVYASNLSLMRRVEHWTEYWQMGSAEAKHLVQHYTPKLAQQRDWSKGINANHVLLIPVMYLVDYMSYQTNSFQLLASEACSAE